MSSSISGLRYQEKKVGGTFKSSKIEYTWEFILDGTPQKIELIDSRWSGKKRLIRNGMEVVDRNNDGSFLKNFQIGNHVFAVISYGDKCELRVDNQSFTHLYNLEKNKNFFTGEVVPTSKVQVVKNFSDNYSSTDQDSNNKFFKPTKPAKENEKSNLFNFSIKTDDNKQTGGLKKFKFGPGVKPTFDKNKKSNDDNNKSNNQNNNPDLLGFGDDNQNNSNNNNSNNNVFGFGNNNNQNNNNDIFGFANNTNNNDNNNQNNAFGFGNNNQDNNSNFQQKSDNNELLDVFSAANQNNNQNNNNQGNTGNKDVFAFDASNANNNFFGQNNNNQNNNNFGFLGSQQPQQTNENNNNSQFNTFGQANMAPNNENQGGMNYPDIDSIGNQNQNNMNQNPGIGFSFVPQESNNFNNIQGFQPSPPGFNYEAYNNANKKQPQTSNEKLENSLKNLF